MRCACWKTVRSRGILIKAIQSITAFGRRDKQMTTYFFDQNFGSDVDPDHEGTDLFDLASARRAAFELLGEAIMFERARLPSDQLAIVVRDEHGPVLRVSATVVAEELNAPPASKT